MDIPASAVRLARRSERMAQINHRLRWARQQVCPPQVGVVGGYHLSNLGDMALGYSVQRRVIASGLSCGLQTIYNLERWPKAKLAIVGGGAVGYGNSLSRLRKTYGCSPDRVAILGVDFNDPAGVCAHADFLRQVSFITCRSSKQAAEMGALLGRKDIRCHPDLCFSLYKETGETSPKTEEPSQILGINCLPLFFRRSGDRFLPGVDFLDEWQREEPQLVAHMERLGTLYCNLVRGICSKANQAGIRIMHIPFTPVDDVFARTVLRGLSIKFVPYTPNIEPVLTQVGRCGRFFTSRLHSMIFSIIKHCEIMPFCYASKCDRLLKDLQIKHPSITRIEDLFGNMNGLVDKVIEQPGIRFPSKVVAALRDDVATKLDYVIAQMQNRAFG
jgi:hypothetical protein